MTKKKRLLIEIVLFIIIVVIISMVYNYFVDNKFKEEIKENEEENKVEVLKITNNNFEQEVLNAEENVIIDFYADWCGPCKMMSPIIDTIAQENSNVKVGKVDVDEAQGLAAEYNVMSIPTIIVFKNGKVHKKFVGVTSKEDILKELY